MSAQQKTLKKIVQGSKNIAFNDMVNLIKGFGFQLSRTNGSHNIFTHPRVQELVNIQEVGGQVKPYQIKQFLKLVEKYNLKLGD